MTLIAPKPNPLEQVESDNDGVSEAEVAAKHAEVERDWRNGNAEKHFERELDSILATSPSSADGEGFSTAEAEKIRREEEELLTELQKHVSVHLRSQQMACVAAQRDGMGTGYTVKVQEKGTGRVWEFGVGYDQAHVVMATDERRSFTALVNMVVEMALETRRAYFERVAANVALIN